MHLLHVANCLLKTGSVPVKGHSACGTLTVKKCSHKFCEELHYSVNSEFQASYHEQGLRRHKSCVTFQLCDLESVFILEQQNPLQFGSHTVGVQVQKTGSLKYIHWDAGLEYLN